jgi:hypothetical protein
MVKVMHHIPISLYTRIVLFNAWVYAARYVVKTQELLTASWILHLFLLFLHPLSTYVLRIIE